ncbi:FtsX-like permease family protein [Pseudodesulfovibrio profundus]|uniref:FtsX-like permease family protein n=1 Tax=Pseudodesulfovibrio profundus TaxID=57320 RepID=A0A2C8F6Y2_9BACT|nr:ABC transporter permease [Pseudodesulfovibrio profundus]SOB58260.1 FtsX-like permease family protein [Pseudodesulfovibrio profundus]
MIFTIARQNLFHDKVRLCVTLTGVVFAVVLITIQVGIFLGFTKTIAAVIDNSGADVWVTSRGVKNFDITLPLDEQKYYQVLSSPGIEEASKFIIRFADWKRPDGLQESIEIIGFETGKGMGGPWNYVTGSDSMLELKDAIIIDQLYMEKLGIAMLGETVEINKRKARVVGFTRGTRSFTTSPFVFASLKTARNYTNFDSDEFTYVLVKGKEGVSPAMLKKSILANVNNVDVYTTPEFSKLTQDYWMYNTGAGAGLLIAAFLGLIVGTVVVAQTLYATTLDHIAEFATLKAMGAPNSYIYKILIAQATLSAVFGYMLGICVASIASNFSNFSATVILLPPELMISMFWLTLTMCVASAFISIRKVTRLDPALVFKGR